MNAPLISLPPDELQALELLLREMAPAAALDSFRALRVELLARVAEADRTIAELERRAAPARIGGAP